MNSNSNNKFNGILYTQEEICSDLGLIMLVAENHTVNHTPNKEWGFPKHVRAGKPHSGIMNIFCKVGLRQMLLPPLKYCCFDTNIMPGLEKVSSVSVRRTTILPVAFRSWCTIQLISASRTASWAAVSSCLSSPTNLNGLGRAWMSLIQSHFGDEVVSYSLQK